MAAGTATLRGLTIGCDTAYPWVGTYPTALLGTADIRENDVVLPRRDGVVAGHDHTGARWITFELQIKGTSNGDAETKALALEEAFAPGPDDEELAVEVSSTPSAYTFIGRPRGVTIIPDRAFVGNSLMHARASFVATDPARYGVAMQEVIGLASHPLPQTLPFILGYHDSETFMNSGATSDRWTVTGDAIGGSVVDPSIAHVGSGQLIFHDLTMSSGDQLVIDGKERRAVLNGTQVVVPTIAQWWSIVPGSNEVRFAAGTASSLSSTATLDWRPVFG